MMLIFLAIACLSVQFFAKYAGHNVKKLPYDLVGLGGLFFLLSAASGLDLSGMDLVKVVVNLVATLAPLLGWLCLLGATLMGMLDLFMHVMMETEKKILSH